MLPCPRIFMSYKSCLSACADFKVDGFAVKSESVQAFGESADGYKVSWQFGCFGASVQWPGLNGR